jgi:succinate--hydroxymethylglutarate CoA-transferase
MPRIDITRCVGYGQSGPYASAAGYDVVTEAEGGLMHMFVEYRAM